VGCPENIESLAGQAACPGISTKQSKEERKGGKHLLSFTHFVFYIVEKADLAYNAYVS